MADQPTPPGEPTRRPVQYPVDMARVETLLRQGQITDVRGTMRWGSNYAALVRVCDDDLEAAAVYKPQRGERPLWDFPDGTLCHREVVTYLISEALGWQLVPPTVLREGPHGLGSLQLFIEHNPEINYFSLDNRFVAQLKRYAAFDYIVNNADRKGGHLLLDSQGKLWGIDHGLTFHPMPKLRTVIWEFAGQRLPQTLLNDVQKLRQQLICEDGELRQQVNSLLNPTEVHALVRRIEHLLATRIFPRPGSGPTYPWPPV